MPSINQIANLLLRVAEKSNHRNFVVIGSLSVVGAMLRPPEDMAYSMDVDVYLKADPGRQDELLLFGENSGIVDAIGCYADPVLPGLVSAEPGWESRLSPFSTPSGIVIWFMDINDAATSKLIRGEVRDMIWVENGIRHGIISPERLSLSISKAENVLEGEQGAAQERLRIILSRMAPDMPRKSRPS